MYKIKNIMGRSTYLTAAFGLLATFVASAVIPATTYADALNPLTERSLMLSSSAPGYSYTDGSGNATYAGPGTGNNGQKTAETFSFLVSSNTTDNGTNALDLPIKAWTFQYCTTPAGECTAPGNYSDEHIGASSNLDIIYSSPVEGTDFAVYTGGGDIGGPSDGGTVSTGWTMYTARVADHDAAPLNAEGNGSNTENNFIVLTNSTGIQLAADTRVWIKFYADDDDYITNPGSGAFFVKVNNYSSDDYLGADLAPGGGDSDLLPDTDDFIIDGGVTVANVMNDSIWLQTKVLETMYFSVGTKNPDTVVGAHGGCDAITENLPLKMGDPTAEDSLSVTTAYDATSYWRLSSNSSSGATVYYSGNTLSNTVGDKIDGLADETVSDPGALQFGLALDTTPDGDLDTGNAPSGGFSTSIAPLVAETDYDEGAGDINGTPTAKFKFVEASLNTPQKFASFDDDIIDCATGKMRYVANIEPSTPAGVYTSKINYIAAPQY